MQPNEYQKLALRTEYTPHFVQLERDHCPQSPESERMARLLHGMIGVCTEAGELQDMVKKNLIYAKPFDLVNVLEECGDLCWYIALALDACGYTFEDCMTRNIDKLRKRFPDKFSPEAALTRDFNAERAALEGLEGNPKG